MSVKTSNENVLDDQPVKHDQPERPGLGQIIIYAIGQLGWSLASFFVVVVSPYFYMPPEDGSGQTFPVFIFQGSILGLFTIVGLVTSGGRIFDAITDPIIASWSDRTNWKGGKRKFGMLIGILPFSLFAILAFFPISAENTSLNTAWFVFTVLLFFLSFTIYVVPYTALIGELGHHPKDRLKISTAISVTWALGYVLGGSIYAIQGGLEGNMGPTAAFQTGVVVLVLFAALCMLVPILFLNEPKYCIQTRTEVSLMDSIREVVKNRNFMIFTFSDLMYWLSISVIQSGMIYNVTLLLGMEKDLASLFTLVSFVLSFLCYIPILILVPKFGKKKVVIFGFFMFLLTFALGASLGLLPIPLMVQFGILTVLSAVALAIFGILPNAIIADVVNQHEQEHGENLSGMYFAFRNFMMKIGMSLGLLIFTSLLVLGKSAENPTGVRLANVAALVFCLIGFILFRYFKPAPETE
ncbi:MAG: MFS transporter [Bacteroidota bacterium]